MHNYVEVLFYGSKCTLLIYACEPHNAYTDGKALYTQQCGGCHGEQGEGLKALVPPLAGTDRIRTTDGRATIPCIINKGMSGKIVVNGITYNEKMPALPQVNPVEITNIINYITHSWGEKMEPISLQEVKNALELCK